MSKIIIVVTEEKPDSGKAFGFVLIVFFLMWWLFGGSSEKPVDALEYKPHSSYYVDTGSAIKGSLEEGVTYTYYRDGSCTDKPSVVKCLSHEQAKEICEGFDGVNTVDTRFSGLSSTSEKGLMSMGIRVEAKNHPKGFIYDQTYSITGLKRVFVGNSCYIKVDLMREYTGQPVYYGEVTSWKLNKNQKLVATWTDVSSYRGFN